MRCAQERKTNKIFMENNNLDLSNYKNQEAAVMFLLE